MKSTVLSVTQLNTYIKSIIDGDSLLRSLYVVGEISNFTNHYRTGHFYLTLKDENCAVKAVMFASANRRLKFMPENGMKVIVRGRVSVFERDGQYQFYIDDMQPDGLGALNLAFEQLKNRLAQEGLFDERFKKPIPYRCMRIGVVTSATGAVIQDIRNVISRRYPLAEIILAPVQVQGASAAPQIVDAIERFNSGDYADVLIVGRGGGSLEDLWAFNDELVAHAIYASKIPVISAVGHEPDVTISDFVADVRAAKPSNAAELAVPDREALQQNLDSMVSSMAASLGRMLKAAKQHLNALSASAVLVSPTGYLEQKEKNLALLMNRLAAAQNQTLAQSRQRYVGIVAKLDAMSPLKVLSRGYSVVRDSDGNILRSAAQTATGKPITITLASGKLYAKVTRKEEEHESEE